MRTLQTHLSRTSTLLGKAKQRPAMTKAIIKMEYLKEAEALIVGLNPQLAGRLEWADLVHGFNVGRTAAETAERYVASHGEVSK
jgi:hypothetical protein